MNVADGQLLPKLLAAALCSTILLVVIDVRGLVGGGGVVNGQAQSAAVRGTLVDMADLIKMDDHNEKTGAAGIDLFDRMAPHPDAIEIAEDLAAAEAERESRWLPLGQAGAGAVALPWPKPPPRDHDVFLHHDHDDLFRVGDRVPPPPPGTVDPTADAPNMPGSAAQVPLPTTVTASVAGPHSIGRGELAALSHRQPLKIALVSTGNTKDHKVFCDKPPAPYNKYVGRCPREGQAEQNDQNLIMATNHGCYAALHGIESIIDTTDYVSNMTMVPTVRNQVLKGNPLDPTSKEYIEQRAALPDRVPVPPYWNKVFSLKSHLPSHDWLVWMDNDMWIANMELSMDELLRKMPDETFMVMPFGDINCFFYIRNSPAGHAFIDRWITMGIRDNPTPAKPPCEHKFGCWEYHDQGWWFASLIEVIQEYNKHPNACFNECQIKSLWTCYIDYAKETKRIGLWPTVAQALNPAIRPQSLGRKAAPVAIVESGPFRWFGRNMAWGGSGLSFDEASRALGYHHKRPQDGRLPDKGDSLGNCFRAQFNYCVQHLGCRAVFAEDGTIMHRCDTTAGGVTGNVGADVELREMPPYKLLNEEGEPGCSKPECECWGCTCQGLSDALGVAHRDRGSFGSVPQEVIAYWGSNKCDTVPASKDKSKRIRLAVAAFNRSACPLKTLTKQ